MILSTSPNVMMRQRPDGSADYGYSAVEQLSTLRSVGFRCFDFNFVDYVRGADACLRRADWEEWMAQIADFARRNQLQFHQAHGHMFEQEQSRAFGISEEASEQCVERSILGAQMLGVKWLVWHPYPDRARLDDTFRRLDRIYEMSCRCRVGMAVENLPAGFCENAAELIGVCERYGDENVGVCWDTGHANLNRAIVQSEEIRRLGARIKALHVADNSGRGDDHLAPYYGTVPWTEVLRALKDAGYRGTLNFEAHNFVGRLPEELRLQSVMLLYQIGRAMAEEFDRL